MKKVSIVTPVYNGVDTLDAYFKVFEAVEAALKQFDVELHYILVDDGSSDETFLKFAEFKALKGERLTAIKLSRNFGAIAASNAGLQHVKGDAFTIYASDLQDPPELLVQMVKAWKEGEKFIICQREKKRKDPFFTKLYAYLYYRLVRLLVAKDFPRTGFDIFFMDAQYLPYLKNTGKNINRALYTYWLGLNPRVIHYQRPERAGGKSKWTLGKKIKLFIDSFLGFSIRPMRIAIVFGLLVASLAFVYGIVVLIGSLLGKIEVSGYASIVVLLSFLFGTVIFILGLIGEYIWRIFDEVNKRPETIIETILE